MIEDPEIGKTIPSKRKSQIYDNLVNMPPAGSSPTEILRDMLRHCGEEDIPVLGTRHAKTSSYDSVSSGSRTVSEEYVSKHVYTSRCDSEVSNVSVSSNTLNSEQTVNQSWNDIVNAAEGNHGDYIDLIQFIDDDPQNSSMELDQNINGSQMSISQISTVASSGYQSYGYSQSSSPVESTTNTSEFHRDFNKSPSTQSNLQPLSFSNPMYRHKYSSASSHGTNVSSVNPTSMSSGSISSEEDSNTVKNRSPIKSDMFNESGDPLRNLAPKLSSSSSSESLDQDHLRFTQSLTKTRSAHEPVKFELHSSCPSKVFEDLHNSNYMSDQSNQGYSLSRAPVRPVELSHTGSMDFTYLRQSGNDGLRRTATDSHIARGDHSTLPYMDGSLSESSSRGQTTPDDSPHRRLSPQNAVHMGIRSVQRKIQEQEKTKQEVSVINPTSASLYDGESLTIFHLVAWFKMAHRDKDHLSQGRGEDRESWTWGMTCYI